MSFIRLSTLSSLLFLSAWVFATDKPETEVPLKLVEPMVGSWTFSGTVSNESGDKYGYFFQVQRQGMDVHVKTALIDAQQNKLVLFYEGDDKIESANELNWHVGKSFIRHNSINDSWIFGVKTEKKQGFNFKVDMGLKNDHNTITLRPGVELEALQTSQLNGHVVLEDEGKEQFVTANKAWYGKLSFSKDQTAAQEINTTFCGLNNENGFFSANLKEANAIAATIAGWRDPLGNKVKMSQFITLKPLDDHLSVLNVATPKLSLKLYNSLNSEGEKTVAGFSNSETKGFCVVTDQSFKKQVTKTA